MRGMDTILYITDLHVGSHVVELAGVFDRATAHRWRVVEIEMDRTNRTVPEILAQWKPAGCIMECGKFLGEDIPRLFRRMPVVYIDPNPSTAHKARHTVANDPEAIARLAARELLMSARAAYVFFGWCTPTVWSVGRGKAFQEILARETASPCRLFEESWDIGNPLPVHRRFAAFLKRLPRPVGIFAVNDYAALQATEACRLLGWECPRDYTLVSVDNEPMHCENNEPTLTSIEQDFRGAGRMAADLLAELLADPKLPPRHLRFGPVQLVRRQSSRALKLNDPRIARAVERIRRDATTGITAADILAEIPLSRRLAEKRFLAATGRTILQEIQEVRLQKIFELLRTDLPIGHIAGRCGMQSDSFLKRFFKSKTGMTLREWRKAHSDGAGA